MIGIVITNASAKLFRDISLKLICEKIIIKKPQRKIIDL